MLAIGLMLLMSVTGSYRAGSPADTVMAGLTGLTGCLDAAAGTGGVAGCGWAGWRAAGPVEVHGPDNSGVCILQLYSLNTSLPGRTLHNNL